MNLNNFFRIRSFTNRILSSDNFSYIKYYYQYLYVLKESPEVMFQYNDIFNNKKYKQNNNVKFSKFKKYVSFIFSKNKLNIVKKNKYKADILIFSHLMPSFDYDKGNDFYFGNLPQELKKTNKKFKIIFRNLNNYQNIKIKNGLILPNSAGLFKEIYFIFKCSLFLYIFKKELKFNFKYNEYSNELRYFTRLSKFYSIINNLRFEYFVEKVLLNYDPKIILTTFEGHSWERILFKKSKEYNKDISILAYQHTMLTNLQNTLLINFPKDYSPTEILTTGKIVSDRFKEKGFQNVKVFGSHKNLNNKIKLKPDNYKILNLNFLILPDAFDYEFEILLNLTLKLCKAYKKNSFIFRPHPKTNLQFKLKKYQNELEKTQNFKISTNSLSNDINLCDIVIYRGSASIIQSCLSGIYPIYYNNNDKLPFDPLFKIFQNKMNQINDYEEINAKIQHFKNSWIKGSDNNKSQLIKYCNSYFENVDYKYLINKI